MEAAIKQDQVQDTKPVRFVPMSPEKRATFFASRFDDLRKRHSALQRKYNWLRHTKMPKLVYVHADQDLREAFELQWTRCQSLLKENEALYELNHRLEIEASESEAFSAYADEAVQLAEREKNSLIAENEELKLRIQQLEGKLLSKDAIISSVSKEGGGIISFGEERDLYDGEHKDLVLDILKRELDNVGPDTRKAHIIKSILSANNKIGTHDSILEKIKTIFSRFHGYSYMNSQDKNTFEDCGFELVSKNGHVKLRFHGDKRYTVIIPNTSSDNGCIGNNVFTDIKKNIL